MKNFSRVAALVALAFSCGVYANDDNSTAGYDDTGFSVASEVGFGHQKIDVSGGFKTESGNSFSPSIALAYNFDSNYSIVAQYTDYGESDLFVIPMSVFGQSVNVDVSAKTTGFSLVGQYMTDRDEGLWSFGGKLGLMAWDTEMMVKASANGQSASESLGDDNGTAIYGGLLASYGLSRNLNLTFNADWFVSEVGVEFAAGETTELLRSRYTMGVSYHF